MVRIRTEHDEKCGDRVGFGGRRYPTQKPLGVLKRIIEVHSSPRDHVLDFFAGSGTTGEAAARADCEFTLIDNSLEAVEVMARRLAFALPECVNFSPCGAMRGGGRVEHT